MITKRKLNSLLRDKLKKQEWKAFQSHTTELIIYLNFSNFRKRKPKSISDDEGEAPKVATNSDKKPNESGNDDLRTLMGEENKNFYDVIEMADALQPKVHNNKSNLFHIDPF